MKKLALIYLRAKGNLAICPESEVNTVIGNYVRCCRQISPSFQMDIIDFDNIDPVNLLKLLDSENDSIQL